MTRIGVSHVNSLLLLDTQTTNIIKPVELVEEGVRFSSKKLLFQMKLLNNQLAQRFKDARLRNELPSYTHSIQQTLIQVTKTGRL